MKVHQCFKHGAAIALLAITLFGCSGAATPDAVEGKQYTLLSPPQTPETQGKIEVIEFFSYGCPHCYHFHPLIDAWAAKLPPNVTLVRVPVSFGRAQWGQLVRTFYTLQALGELKRLDGAFFDAIHKDQRPLFDEESITAWAASKGIDAAKFRETFESPAVTAKALHANDMSTSYQVDGVPKMVVGGKYIVQASTFQEMLENTDLVLAKAAAGGGAQGGK